MHINTYAYYSVWYMHVRYTQVKLYMEKIQLHYKIHLPLEAKDKCIRTTEHAHVRS